MASSGVQFDKTSGYRGHVLIVPHSFLESESLILRQCYVVFHVVESKSLQVFGCGSWAKALQEGKANFYPKYVLISVKINCCLFQGKYSLSP